MEVAVEDPIAFSKKLQKNKEVAAEDSENPGSTIESLDVNMINSSNSDLSIHDDANDEEDAMDEDVGDSDYYDDDDDDDDDYVFDNDVDDDSDYLKMQAQFDNVDLPPGVEASVSWIQPSAVSSSTSTTSNVAAGTSAPVNLHPSNEKIETAASSSSVAKMASSSHEKEKDETEDEILRKYKAFKSFDIVDDYSDHNYCNMGIKGEQPAQAWTKKVQDEWRILEKDLPGTIFARAYEARMDLMRAVIVGPQGTPYHDGLFVFDIYFPPTYPQVPPMVYYYSGGLRLNPNLYDNGKVCLSLLNTWTGKGSEKWLPATSTMLQVLVSIQALILNAKPFFNEPGYDRDYPGNEGEILSNKYSEDALIMSLKTMMYTLRRPPKHFEDLVAGHFRVYAHDILEACKAYMEGAQVASLVHGKPVTGKVVKQTSKTTFKDDVAKMVNGLVSNFTRYGAKDCEKYRVAR